MRYLRNKKLFATLAVLGVFCIAVFWGAREALAQDAIDRGLGTLVYYTLGLIAQAFTWIGGALITALISVLISFAQYNNFTNVGAVNTAWVVIRDLANMAFILILLVIAFATILRVESYQYKKLLPRVVMMAVLINFSKTIAGLIIDFGQVVMLTFVNGFAAAAGGNFTVGFGLHKILSEGIGTSEQAQQHPGTVTINYFLAIIYIIIAVVTVGVMIAMLLFRIVMLWMLVALSPMAFLLAAFPQGESYSSKWWKEFTSAVVVGPVLAFFLWMSLIAMAPQNSTTPNSPSGTEATLSNSTSGIAEAAKQQGEKVCIGSSAAGCAVDIASFVLSIGMLWAGIYITQQIGGMVGDRAAGWAKEGVSKGFRWTKSAAWGTTKFAAERLNRLQGKGAFGWKGTGVDFIGLPGKIMAGFEARKKADYEKIGARGGELRDKAWGTFMQPMAMAFTAPEDFVKRYGSITGAVKAGKDTVGNLFGTSDRQQYEQAQKIRKNVADEEATFNAEKEALNADNVVQNEVVQRDTDLEAYAKQEVGSNAVDWTLDDELDKALIQTLKNKEDALARKIRSGQGNKQDQKALDDIQSSLKNKNINRTNYEKYKEASDPDFDSYTIQQKNSALNERMAKSFDTGVARNQITQNNAEIDRLKNAKDAFVKPMEAKASALESQYYKNVPAQALVDLEDRKAEAEVMKNIPSNATLPELLRLLKQAQANGPSDAKTFNVLLKKLAQDASTGDVLKEFGYQKTGDGFQQFIDDVVTKMNAGKEDKAFSVAYDMSRNAEKAGELQYASTYKMDVRSGVVEKNDMDVATQGVAGRAAKKSASDAAKFSLEAYVSDGALTDMGGMLVSSFDKGFKDMIDKGTFPPALLQALQGVAGSLKKMQDKGLVSKEFMDSLMQTKKERPPKLANIRAALI